MQSLLNKAAPSENKFLLEQTAWEGKQAGMRERRDLFFLAGGDEKKESAEDGEERRGKKRGVVTNTLVKCHRVTADV